MAFSTGLNPSIIGGFSGLCAFMGVAATFLSAYLVQRFGILKVGSYVCLSCYQSTRISGSGCSTYRYFASSFSQAGAVGLVLQASLLTVAVAVYWGGSLSQQSPLLFFLGLIVRTIHLFSAWLYMSIFERPENKNFLSS